MSGFLAAVVQLRATADVGENLRAVESLVARAAAAGARLVATPENTSFLGTVDEKLRIAEPAGGPVEQRLAALAAKHAVHLLVGSIPERRDDRRCWNASLLFGPDGALLARYHKLHLFDVDLPGGPRLEESASVAPGDTLVVVDTALGRLGLTVCYDVRFPELFVALREAGAEILCVPSAFTVPTGADHWHVLLRARAIETQCHVLAPAQEGRHDPAGLRHSYGHSLIVDPWGTVLAELGAGPGVAWAWVDPQRTADVRAAMPVASHRRLRGPALVKGGAT